MGRKIDRSIDRWKERWKEKWEEKKSEPQPPLSPLTGSLSHHRPSLRGTTGKFHRSNGLVIFDTCQLSPALGVCHPCQPIPPGRATEILAALSRCARGSVHAELAVGMARTTFRPWKSKAMPTPHCKICLLNTGLLELEHIANLYIYIYLSIYLSI